MTEADWLASKDPAAMLRYLTDGEIEGDYASPGRHERVRRKATDRKFRLFACACCRLVWDGAVCGRCGGTGEIGAHKRQTGLPPCPDCRGTGKVGGLTDPRSRRAVEVAERYADGGATAEELFHAHTLPGGTSSVVYWAVQPAPLSFHQVQPLPSPAAQAALIRGIFGNPWLAVGFEWRPDGLYLMVGEERTELPRGRARGVLSRTEVKQLWRRVNWLTPTVISLASAAYDKRQPDGLLDPARLAVLADALEEAGCGPMLPTFAPHPIVEHLRSAATHARGCWVVDLLLGKA